MPSLSFAVHSHKQRKLRILIKMLQNREDDFDVSTVYFSFVVVLLVY